MHGNIRTRHIHQYYNNHRLYAAGRIFWTTILPSFHIYNAITLHKTLTKSLRVGDSDARCLHMCLQECMRHTQNMSLCLCVFRFCFTLACRNRTQTQNLEYITVIYIRTNLRLHSTCSHINLYINNIHQSTLLCI